MATLRPGPYTLEFPQQFAELTHKLEFNCDVLGTPASGDAPSTIMMRDAGSTGLSDLATAANDLWGVIRPFFTPSTLCSTYTLWKRTLTTTERIFVSGGILTSPNGSGSGVNTPASQATYTLRSGAGGYLKVIFLEGLFTSSSRIPMSSDTLTAVPAFRTYLLGDGCIVMARDRGFPVATMNSSYGQNEKIFDRRYRS